MFFLIINVTMYIAIIAALIIIIAFVFFAKRGRNINPIDSITLKGTLGLCRGDSYKFVLSRIKWLNLPIKKHDFEGESIIGYWGMGRIEIVDDYWGLIHEVSFSFKDNQLDGVYMKMNYSEYGLEEMFGIVKTRITRVLNINPMYTSDDFVKWGYSNTGFVSLSIMNKTELLVMVLSK